MLRFQFGFSTGNYKSGLQVLIDLLRNFGNGTIKAMILICKSHKFIKFNAFFLECVIQHFYC